ncbi:MAG: hypothetical protein IKM68_03760 [Bacteroidaceae bacterium]|nr:hypothetical protein [Bacteroidaceae bacterium]
MRKIMMLLLLALLALSSCYREPPLHLYDIDNPALALPIVELSLDTYWNYDGNLGINYDWRAEWYYGWDDEDRRIFGELEYEEPTKFFLRRYYTGNEKEGTRIERRNAYISGRTFRASYDWGFWDILAWNDVKTIDGVQSLNFDEKSSYDEDIIAYTNTTMYSSRYYAPRYQNSFYEPEQLFSACEKGVEINKNLDGFEYDEENDIWIRKLNMYLEPLTYIYLPQIILHNNRGRINGVQGIANLSGMARFTSLNSGIAGTDAIAVNFNVRLKNDKDFKAGEKVDIAGGRIMTFGICGLNANRVSHVDDKLDSERHYLDLNMTFNNGMDSTFVFDVTDQVRKRYKGGVITIELDVDTVPIPRRKGGSGFNAVVKDYEDGGTWEFPM